MLSTTYFLKYHLLYLYKCTCCISTYCKAYSTELNTTCSTTLGIWEPSICSQIKLCGLLVSVLLWKTLLIKTGNLAFFCFMGNLSAFQWIWDLSGGPSWAVIFCCWAQKYLGSVCIPTCLPPLSYPPKCLQLESLLLFLRFVWKKY